MTFKIEPVIMSVSKHSSIQQLDRWHKVEDNGSGVTYYWQSFGSLGSNCNNPTATSAAQQQSANNNTIKQQHNSRNYLNGFTRSRTRLAPAPPTNLIWSASKQKKRVCFDKI